jgi:hypothetical protein
VGLAAKIDDFATRLDELGKPAWIALLVLSFIVFWPLGVAVLAYLIWSGRMACSGGSRWQSRMRPAGRWYGAQPSSGNRAFDEYREETLRRLEDEQREFKDFLERLRLAKDKAEFDQFMADRRQPRPAPDAQRPAPEPMQG